MGDHSPSPLGPGDLLGPALDLELPLAVQVHEPGRLLARQRERVGGGGERHQRGARRQLVEAGELGIFPALGPARNNSGRTTALSIRGVTDDVKVKEYSHAVKDGKHVWTVLLATDHTGTVRLAVDFEQRLSEADAANLTLPIIRAANVAYQTQMVSVEGDPAVDVDLQTTMRRVDVGELAEAEQMPGRRLLGAFASTADDNTIQVNITRRDLRPLPAAIVQRAELVTLVSTAGVSQSAARYLLQTKLPYLAIRFPPDAEPLVRIAQRHAGQTAAPRRPDRAESANGADGQSG